MRLTFASQFFLAGHGADRFLDLALDSFDDAFDARLGTSVLVAHDDSPCMWMYARGLTNTLGRTRVGRA